MVIELRTVEFDPRQLPRSFYDDKIRELTEQHEADLRTARETLRELTWWKQALEMFVTPPDSSGAPAGEGTTTLSDAILIAFGDPTVRLRPAEVIERLNELGTLPSALSARQMVRNRLLSMMERRLLRRDDSGFYALGPRGVEKLASDQRRAET